MTVERRVLILPINDSLKFGITVWSIEDERTGQAEHYRVDAGAWPDRTYTWTFTTYREAFQKAFDHAAWAVKLTSTDGRVRLHNGKESVSA